MVLEKISACLNRSLFMICSWGVLLLLVVGCLYYPVLDLGVVNYLDPFILLSILAISFFFSTVWILCWKYSFVILLKIVDINESVVSVSYVFICTAVSTFLASSVTIGCAHFIFDHEGELWDASIPILIFSSVYGIALGAVLLLSVRTN